MVILFGLYSSWSFADVRTLEICQVDSFLVREVNRSRTEISIDAAGGAEASPHHVALLALLRDRRAVITVSDGATLDAVIGGIADDGAILSAGFRGTTPDCVNVRTGHEVWSTLSSAEFAAR